MNVLVLLSSYNGEKYIREQILSIISQTNINLKLLIRDDGSSDTTPEIIKQSLHEFPDIIEFIEGDNIGCRLSFFSLIKEAQMHYPDFDYYAFADQDDVWMADKLESGVKNLQKVDQSLKLYFCHPQLVDENLNTIDKKISSARCTLAEAFMVAPALGCTMIFSPDVLAHVYTICKTDINCLHDFLTYIVTLSLGGKVIEDTKPHILYRQHSSNVVGGSQSFKKKWSRRLSWFIRGERHMSNITATILSIFRNEIPSSEKQILNTFSFYHNSVIKKMQILFSKEFASNRPLHNLMFKIAVIFNKK